MRKFTSIYHQAFILKWGLLDAALHGGGGAQGDTDYDLKLTVDTVRTQRETAYKRVLF